MDMEENIRNFDAHKDGPVLLAIDQGTSGTFALVVNAQGEVLAKGYAPISSYSPQPAWVEHDPLEILRQTAVAVQQAVESSGVAWRDFAGVGIANQRETTVLWEKETGKPLAPAIGWQCRRTSSICRRPKLQEARDLILQKTGLPMDPYFSATKIMWLMEQIPEFKHRAIRGEVLFGTVDSWLVWNLTGGEKHITDCSNASRTMLFNLRDLVWDPDLFDLFDVPPGVLPEVVDSAGKLGTVELSRLPGAAGVLKTAPPLPLCAVAGDQQAALFGQCCFQPGEAKATYGTGAFVLMNSGSEPPPPYNRLVGTVAWKIGAKAQYALEGSTFSAGTVIKWLRDSLRILDSAQQSEWLAQNVPDSGGVFFVPALAGLGAPYWSPDTRGALFGVTAHTAPSHIVRAALEGIAQQVADVAEEMTQATGVAHEGIKADGGMATNGFLMQSQADILGQPVVRPVMAETTAIGVAYMAGLGAGLWGSLEDITNLPRPILQFEPSIDEITRLRLRESWRCAVSLARQWQPAP